MDSLQELLYRGTLPLAAAWNAAKGGNDREPTVAEIASFVTPIKDISDNRLNLPPPNIDSFARTVKELKLKSRPPPYESPSRDFIPLWGYKAAGLYNTATEFSCLVDDVDYDEYARMLVLSSVEFGDSETRTAEDFGSYVTVYFNKKRIQLELGKASYLNSFVTNGKTWTSGADDPLWKNKLKFDPSFVHVFLFDLVREDDGSYKADPVTDATALARYYKANEALEAAAKAGLDGSKAEARDVLFKDDLWTTHPQSQSPSGSVPSEVVIGTVIARIVVTCSVAVSRWDKEPAAGRATGEALIYPHIMIASTTKLDSASGGVLLRRPSEWTMMEMRMKSERKLLPHNIPLSMMDYMHAADPKQPDKPYHMTKEIDALLITDSNEEVMTVGDFRGPFVVWSNLFNYYIDDPVKELGGSVIKVVDHTRTKKLSEKASYNAVERDTSDVTPSPAGFKRLFRTDPEKRVSKYERQGAFDSVHMAPRMKIPEGLITRIAETDFGLSHALTSADFAQLKMDRIATAPFCPHDCFHMHWRWTDNLNNDQYATRGWGEKEPNKVVGAPMVRHNQDVYVGLPNPHTILYLADIHGIPADDWQVICHHGAFYALTTSPLVTGAQLEVYERLDGDFFGAGYMTIGVHSYGQIPFTYWSLFYWRLRYRVVWENGHFRLQERRRFVKDWKKAAYL